MRNLKAVIIENDKDVVNTLQRFAAENSVLFSIIATASSFKNIHTLINEHKPDVLMIDSDHLEFKTKFLDEVSVRKPKLLFLANDKSKAFDAYTFNAVDFLLKPLTANSLIISIYKVIKYIEMETVFQKDVLGKINIINQTKQDFEYVSIASVDKIELLKTDDIVFCKADGKYTEFYTKQNSKKISSRNLGEYALILGANFFRVHHSYIINVKYLVKVTKNNGLFCELTNEHIIPVAKRRQEEFMKYINQ